MYRGKVRNNMNKKMLNYCSEGVHKQAIWYPFVSIVSSDKKILYET